MKDIDWENQQISEYNDESIKSHNGQLCDYLMFRGEMDSVPEYDISIENEGTENRLRRYEIQVKKKTHKSGLPVIGDKLKYNYKICNNHDN